MDHFHKDTIIRYNGIKMKYGQFLKMPRRDLYIAKRDNGELEALTHEQVLKEGQDRFTACCNLLGHEKEEVNKMFGWAEGEVKDVDEELMSKFFKTLSIEQINQKLNDQIQLNEEAKYDEEAKKKRDKLMAETRESRLELEKMEDEFWAAKKKNEKVLTPMEALKISDARLTAYWNLLGFEREEINKFYEWEDGQLIMFNEAQICRDFEEHGFGKMGGWNNGGLKDAIDAQYELNEAAKYDKKAKEKKDRIFADVRKNRKNIEEEAEKKKEREMKEEAENTEKEKKAKELAEKKKRLNKQTRDKKKMKKMMVESSADSDEKKKDHADEENDTKDDSKVKQEPSSSSSTSDA